MKYIFFFSLIFFVSKVHSNSRLPCELEKYFQLTDLYKSSLLDNNAKKLEMERERLSLLPDINLSMGQQSSNNSSFKGVMDSSLSVGLSMSVYRGNIYSKYKDKI
ncbi:hypothetical protein D5933_21740, partial [Salmonella enterica subsp. enterica serovar Oranienburg]|nr:hypothetical protein [Salmonella enterica subsp. enterica serovar Oranienburg]